jgi:hypothetical protein
MYKIKEFQHKDHTVEIYQDEHAESPREWDNLGTMAFFHRRYNVGVNHEFSEPEDLQEFLDEENPIALIVRGYDHGGFSISTGNGYPYNDPWDSGQLGVIYVERDKVKEEYGWEYLTSQRIAKIESYLKNEVETYDLFLQGRIYGYISTCNRCESEDSVWGFFGEEWKKNGLMDYIGDYCQCEERAYSHLMTVKE